MSAMARQVVENGTDRNTDPVKDNDMDMFDDEEPMSQNLLGGGGLK